MEPFLLLDELAWCEEQHSPEYSREVQGFAAGVLAYTCRLSYFQEPYQMVHMPAAAEGVVPRSLLAAEALETAEGGAGESGFGLVCGL